ncbi:hypothetical protein KW823_27125, partial [Enterobacter quasiroggenkampii]|nr:hypothetical protein [Enterobacter quasiroggenkampii]
MREDMHEGKPEGMYEAMNKGMNEGMCDGMLRTMEMPSDDLGKIHGSTCAVAQPCINANLLRSAEVRVEV